MTSPLLTGTRINHYEILAPLGKGGMGEVYLAHDTKLDRKVALKILASSIAPSKDRMRRFIKEAKTAAALNHPNIAQVYESGISQNTNFIVIEFVDGETLRHRLSDGRTDLSEALDVSVQIASALSAAHAAGIIHRDLKPDNVMRRHDGIVKVLDFGLAKLIEKAEKQVNRDATTRSAMQTKAGELLGTVAYMSPEQARGLTVDERTDIFSLGVLVYEMIAGTAPFVGPTTSDLIAAILEKEPRPLSLLIGGIPPQLEWIVMKALTKEKEERYQSAKELLVDLKRLKNKLAVDSEIKRLAVAAPGAGTSGEQAQDSMENSPSDGTPMHVRAIAEQLLEKIQEFEGRAGVVTGVTTGFADLDRLTSGLQKAHLITVVAPAGVGTTSLCLNIAQNAAFIGEASVVFFSLQLSKDLLMSRIICSRSTVELNRFRDGFLSRPEWTKIAQTLTTLADTKLFIDDSSNLSLKRLREKVRKITAEGRVDLIVLDYVQLLSDLGWEKRGPQGFVQVARSMKALAVEFDVPILVSLRLSSPLFGLPLSNSPDFTPYSIFEQFSDLVLLISETEHEETAAIGLVDLLLLKNNNGPTRPIELVFRKEFALFETPPEEQDLRSEFS